MPKLSRGPIIAVIVLAVVIGLFVFFGGKKAEGPIVDVNGTGGVSTTPSPESPVPTPASPTGMKTPPSTVKAGASSSVAPTPPVAAQPVSGTRAKELVAPSWYVNTHNDPLTIAGFKGKKVVLLEFWTYANLNSRRTIPYLNEWYTKYRDKGLEIIAVHTPEFAFEKDQTRVQNATTEYGMAYPVVLDNAYATWNAYGNKNWPHLYLIDIDGNIAYDHVGEGAYEATELKLQELLRARAARLKLNVDVALQIAPPAKAIPVSLTSIKTPELYLGGARNANLGNGTPQKLGTQSLVAPTEIKPNTFTLGGEWSFLNEYATPKTPNATIGVRYTAKRVYLIGAAPGGMIRVRVTRDGQPLGTAAGKDVTTDQYGKSSVLISTERIYEIVNDPAGYGEHVIEFTIENPGLQAYVIRFG
jgi:thiol-disulfide isomerase/thioredoxin